MFKNYKILVIWMKSFFLIQHSLKSNQLRHEFQEINSHHGVEVANGWKKTT